MPDGRWPQDIKWTAVLLPFCTFLPFSPIPIPSRLKYLYSFLFTVTPIIREKGTNSLPIYGMHVTFNHFQAPNPVQVSSQAHSTELSSVPSREKHKEEKCKMGRLCHGLCQAALLYPGLGPCNLTPVFMLGPFSRTNSHLRQQVLSTALPYSSAIWRLSRTILVAVLALTLVLGPGMVPALSPCRVPYL